MLFASYSVKGESFEPCDAVVVSVDLGVGCIIDERGDACGVLVGGTLLFIGSVGG